MKITKGIAFEIGGRYRNRIGWYEIMDVKEKEIRVRYEHDKREDTLPIELQQRIILNISQEEESVMPYKDIKSEKNKIYFQTLGYLVNNGFIEAIIPLQSKTGFDSTFRRIKGRSVLEKGEGYYVHHDPHVDKWGTEMRLTFKVPKAVSLKNLDFGPDVKIVDSPKSDELRINPSVA